MNSVCKTLVRSSFFSLHCSNQLSPLPYSSIPGIKLKQCRKASTRCCISTAAAISVEAHGDSNKDTVTQLLAKKNDVGRLMKMERKRDDLGSWSNESKHWFPYLDKLRVLDGGYLNSAEVLEAMDPYIMDMRKERLRNVVKNRSYSVCLVVEGLTDFGNVSAAFRSADAMGIQSVHVVSCDSSKRCKVY